jgi:hypothetical protein
MLNIVIFVSFLSFFLTETASAQKVERIGGDFRIAEIKTLRGSTPSPSDERFHIKFVSSDSKSKYSCVVLDSQHVHVGLKEGDTLRMSAEIAKSEGNCAVASQVVVYVPHVNGAVPVWMLSTTVRPSDHPPGSYLKMHAPSTDYTIF